MRGHLSRCEHVADGRENAAGADPRLDRSDVPPRIRRIDGYVLRIARLPARCGHRAAVLSGRGRAGAHPEEAPLVAPAAAPCPEVWRERLACPQLAVVRGRRGVRHLAAPRGAAVGRRRAVNRCAGLERRACRRRPSVVDRPGCNHGAAPGGADLPRSGSARPVGHVVGDESRPAVVVDQALRDLDAVRPSDRRQQQRADDDQDQDSAAHGCQPTADATGK